MALQCAEIHAREDPTKRQSRRNERAVLRIRGNRRHQARRTAGVHGTKTRASAGEGSHDFDVEFVLWADAAALLQIGSVAIKSELIIADLADGKSTLDFRDTVFETILGAEADTIAKLAERDTIIAAIGVLDIFDAGMSD